MAISVKRVLGCGAIVLVGTFGAVAVSAGSASAADAVASDSVSFGYQGRPEYYMVPDAGVGHLVIAAEGGRGGDIGGAKYDQGDAGGVVRGTLAVTPGERLRISVGGAGSTPESSSHDLPGGWGGLGGNGGSGNGAKDTLRSSGSGGGATTVEALIGSDWKTVLIAGGGGGEGGQSGDVMTYNFGGGGGWTIDHLCEASNQSWNGADGNHGSSILGGAGGRAASSDGMAGDRGQGGHGLGGNGGGGGGGVFGGAGGGGAKGTSAGGGGGAGGSVNYLLDNASVDNASCSGLPRGGMAQITLSE